MSPRLAIVAGLLILGGSLLAVWLLAPSVFIEVGKLLDSERINGLVAAAGPWGPFVIVALMTVAVVASPIPSAPIALAAGAAYGHIWGTVLVVIGAELGALIAFGVARVLGQDVLRRVFGDKLDKGLLGSQTALTAMVFATRLMPFVSFDMISYAAGLSRLHAWRFAWATLAGIIPASFLLAHFGKEAASGDMGRAIWAVVGLGLMTGAPLLWVAMRRKPKDGATDDC